VAEVRKPRPLPVRSMVVRGVLGAVGGLMVAALWIFSGMWLTTHASSWQGPELVGVVMVLAGPVGVFIAVQRLGVHWSGVPEGMLLHLLMLYVVTSYDHALLDRRGEPVQAVVLSTTYTTPPTPGSWCRVRLPDGTESSIEGCRARTGDRLTVRQDPEGKVSALDVVITDRQWKWVTGVCAAGFLVLGAQIGIQKGRYHYFGTAAEAPTATATRRPRAPAARIPPTDAARRRPATSPTPASARHWRQVSARQRRRRKRR